MIGRELVLLADDEPLSREYLHEALQSCGFEVHAVADGDAAIAALGRNSYDFVFTDLKMPGRDGYAVLLACKEREPDRAVVLVTAHGTMDVAVAALRGGADDILEKPVGLAELELCCERLRLRRRLVRENRFFRDQSTGEDLLAEGPAMRVVVALIDRIAPSKAAVLIQGESGTGKERAAAMLHKRGDRHTGPFLKLNCAAVAESLMESELFGHEQGAFTGAQKRREGLFELASGGTLFLDEVGEMSAAMQSKLLRVLQEGELQRVGGSRTIAVDVRVIAATHRDLEREVAAGRFRQDLYYRLAVVPITLPPLRDRPEEILPLARHFLRAGLTLDAAAERLLCSWRWPGNVRELQNVVQRASLLCEGEVVNAQQLAAWLHPEAGQNLREPTVVLTPFAPRDPITVLVGTPLEAVEDQLIRATLDHCGGNRAKTADMLGIGVRTLFNKLRLTAAQELA